MRVSRAQATENRRKVIDVASRLFREHGFDGVGLNDVMKGAGLTQGGFYKQFESKEDLVAQASAHAMQGAEELWSTAAAASPQDPFAAVVAFYLSPGHRGERAEGCPLVALGSDAGRQSADVKAAFEQGVRAHLDALEKMVPGTSPDKAAVLLSLMVGALALSRMVNDDALSRRFLEAATRQLRTTAAG